MIPVPLSLVAGRGNTVSHDLNFKVQGIFP